MVVNFQQHLGEIGAFHICLSKYLLTRYSYKINNILMSLLLRTSSRLAFFVVIFTKDFKNWVGSILKLTFISQYLLISYSFLTQLCIYSHRINLSDDIELNAKCVSGIWAVSHHIVFSKFNCLQLLIKSRLYLSLWILIKLRNSIKW